MLSKVGFTRGSTGGKEVLRYLDFPYKYQIHLRIVNWLFFDLSQKEFVMVSRREFLKLSGASAGALMAMRYGLQGAFAAPAIPGGS